MLDEPNLGESICWIMEPFLNELYFGVTVSKNDPYLIIGGIGFIGDNIQWADDSSRVHYTLCRCGSSNNKPFCDGMHKSINFIDANK